MLLNKKFTLGLTILSIAAFMISGCGDDKKKDNPTPTTSNKVVDPYDPTVFPKRRHISAKPNFKFVFGDKEANIYTIHTIRPTEFYAGQMYASPKRLYFVDTNKKKIHSMQINAGKVGKASEIGTVEFPASSTYDANEKGLLWRAKANTLSWYNNVSTKTNIKSPWNNNHFVLRKNSKSTSEVWYVQTGDIHKATIVANIIQTPTIIISARELKKKLGFNQATKLHTVDDKAMYFTYTGKLDNRSHPFLVMTDLSGNKKFEFAGVKGGMPDRWVVTNNYVLQFDLLGNGIIYSKADGSKISDFKLPNNLGVTAASFAEGNDIYIKDNKKTIHRIDL